MAGVSGFGYVAEGNILPRRFLKTGTTVGKVLAATAGAQCIGISGESTRNPPYSTLDDTYHAIAGEAVKVYLQGDVCFVESGAAFSIGVRLKASTAGVAIAIAGVADGEEYGAVALDAASAANQFIPVRVAMGQLAVAGTA